MYHITLFKVSHHPLAKKFHINVDASTLGQDSVIWQPRFEDEEMNAHNIISFRSYALKVYERRYAGSPYKLELLALVTALQDYHDFIWGRPIIVFTDHRALTFIHEHSGSNRHLATWMDTILNYTFEIVHIPGTRNGLADALSRLYPNLWGIPCMGTSEFYFPGNACNYRRAPVSDPAFPLSWAFWHEECSARPQAPRI